MQIYTKILIGMAVGAVIGLVAGPNSQLLEHDLYQVANSGSASLFLDKDNQGSRLKVPSGVPLDLKRLEVVDGEVTDSVNKPHTVPIWAKVELKISNRLALLDQDESLRKSLKASAGETATVWLKLEHEKLEGGGLQAKFTPVSSLGDTVISAMAPIGDLFMRLIKMVIVPLVFASLLVGVASLGDIRKLGRMGGRTLGLYMITTAIAVAIGLLCAHVIQPGDFISEADKAALVSQFTGAASSKASAAAAAPSTIENLLNIIPANPMASLSSGNMLQIIFFAVILGVALTMLGEGEGKIVVTFFDKIQAAMIVVIHMVMAIAPYGVAALVAGVVGTSGFSVLQALLVYSATVVIGLILHAVLIYGGIVKIFAKIKVGAFLNAIRPAQLIAFSTSSSSAALPVSMEVAEQNLGISNSTASFVLPLGSTVNMDGTALYQGVAAIFIAQVFDVNLTIGDELAIVGAATMASVGAAGVPGAGMVTLAMVLTASGIPQVGLALILGMDRLLDMVRTAVNVTGDLAVTSAMAVAEGETLMTLKPDEDLANPEVGFEGRLDKEGEALEPDKG